MKCLRCSYPHTLINCSNTFIHQAYSYEGAPKSPLIATFTLIHFFYLSRYNIFIINIINNLQYKISQAYYYYFQGFICLIYPHPYTCTNHKSMFLFFFLLYTTHQPLYIKCKLLYITHQSFEFLLLPFNHFKELTNVS